MTSIADGSVHIQTTSESNPSAPSWLGEVVLAISYIQCGGSVHTTEGPGGRSPSWWGLGIPPHS
jgi:hypothetical protein